MKNKSRPGSTYEQKNFRDILRFEFEKRLQQSNQYSMRTFAEDIGISPSRLSEVLNDNAGLSRQLAEGIATRLGFTAERTQYFTDLVASQHARSRFDRSLAKQRLRYYKAEAEQAELQPSLHTILDRWYYSAVLMLVDVHGEKSNVDFFAKALRISAQDVQDSLRILVELGFLEKELSGSYRRTGRHYLAKSSTPSTVIRKFHKDIAARAVSAIDRQPIAKRKYLSNIICVPKDMLADARDEIETFNKYFLDRYSTSEDGDAVYGFAMQLFQMTDEVQ